MKWHRFNEHERCEQQYIVMKSLNNRYLKSPSLLTPELLLTAGSFITFLLYLLYLREILHFNMFRSDVLQYWKMSFHWNTPFNVWWTPGYPLLIALIRLVTFNIFSPLVIMTGISLVAFLIATQTVYKEAVENKCYNPAFFALVFMFFPFTGLNFSVFPMADISSISLFFCAIHNLKRSRLKRFVLYSALALLFHKVMWFFVPPVTIWGIFTFRKSRFLFILTYLPLLLWIVAGALYHGEFFWFMKNSYEFLFATKKTSFLFDGIITSLFSSSTPKVIKGVILLSITFFTAFCFYTSIKRRLWISAGICISLLAISATVNYYEAWIIARYSKLLIIPIIFLCVHHPQVKGIHFLKLAIILIFLFSNLIFGYYMVIIFYT